MPAVAFVDGVGVVDEAVAVSGEDTALKGGIGSALFEGRHKARETGELGMSAELRGGGKRWGLADVDE